MFDEKEQALNLKKNLKIGYGQSKVVAPIKALFCGGQKITLEVNTTNDWSSDLVIEIN
jgi:hypothetical protein